MPFIVEVQNTYCHFFLFTPVFGKNSFRADSCVYDKIHTNSLWVAIKSFDFQTFELNFGQMTTICKDGTVS